MGYDPRETNIVDKGLGVQHWVDGGADISFVLGVGWWRGDNTLCFYEVMYPAHTEDPVAVGELLTVEVFGLSPRSFASLDLEHLNSSIGGPHGFFVLVF